MRDESDMRDGRSCGAAVAVIAAALAFAVVGTAFAQGRRLLQGNFGNRGQQQQQQPVQQPAVDPNADPSALNWDAAPVDIVLQAYGERVGKTILKDPACPSANITLKTRSGQKLTDEEYIEAIETVLEMNGVHLEPYGESFIRALPRKDVRKEGIPLIMDPDSKIDEAIRVVSVMIPFKNIAIDEAQKVLEGLKSNSGVLLVFERTNSILATDTSQNINRMLEIVKMVDVATPVTESVFVRQIKNASAQEIEEAIKKIVEESQKEQEKNGKQNRPNQAAQPNRPVIPAPSSLLRRPNAQQQPAAPVNNESVFMSVSDADRGMIRGKVVIVTDERSNKIIFVTSKSNMDFFDKVIEQLDVETTPDTVVKVYRLKYAEAEDVSDMINDLIGNAPSAKNSTKGNQNQAAKSGTGGNLTQNRTTPAAPKKSANQRTGESKAGELSKENTTVLADKRINGLVVMTDKDLVPTIEAIIESMDIKLSQVLIETVIIEVTLGNGIETGMDWVQKGRQRNYPLVRRTTDSSGNVSLEYVENTYVPKGYSRTSTDSDGNTIVEMADTAAEIARDGIMNYYTGGAATALGGGANNGSQAYNIGAGLASNVFGRAFNFVFDSDKLGLTAVLQAAKTDSRTKYIASPIIMTLDNKEATIEATQMRYLFKGYQYSGSTYNGSAVPDYEQKELGIKIKVTPKINPNGTVMLKMEEEYSQRGGTQPISGQNGESILAENTVTRNMSADSLLENGQTVIFAGLTETSVSEAESGIPFLKDIPWIGKWLFGSVSKEEDRKELLVFMTPFVLDDAEAAQAEALRRKKTMSDPRPWDDHGWSASKLADPVSRKEQLRRLKDEWAKQDEERQTRIAIEKEKVDRVKKLQSLTKEERDLWLKLHKDELEKEEREELEKKMLDKESQDELRKLAEEVKAKRLKAAEKAESEAAEKERVPNEREKLDAAKAEPAAKAEEAGEAKAEPAAKAEEVGEAKTAETGK